MNKINILLVEDERGISKIMKSYLENDGYNVFQAFDGKSALDIFENEDIDLILLDLMIPEISGEDLIKEIRNKSNVPVIMVTAKVNEDDIINGLKLGADDYVTKPFSPKELMQRIKTVLRRIEKYSIPRADIIKTTDGRLEMDLEYNRFLRMEKKFFLQKMNFKS